MLTDIDHIKTNKLRELRVHRGLPMYALAVKAAVSPTTVGMIERYDYRPGARVREQLATALGVQVGEIWPEGETAA